MTEVISILALLVSLLLLGVHYRNQLERRHGEIAQLRSDFLTRMSVIQQRMTSITLHAETARLELRRMPDSDDKFNSIEIMPTLINKLKEADKQLKQISRTIEGLDTREKNRSEVLLILQSVSHDLKSIEDIDSTVENEILALLERIRFEQSPRGNEPKQ